MPRHIQNPVKHIGWSYLWKWANPKVPDMTPEGFDQVYLPNSNRFMDDIILIHNSHLGGGTENEKLWLQILVTHL